MDDATTITNNTCLSILTLCNYAQLEGYDRKIHLIFCVENLPEIIMNETRNILKAESIQYQYVFQDTIRLFEPNFGRTINENFDIKAQERKIADKVENIIAIDIALLKFVAKVPDLVAKNSFKLPRNVDTNYLMKEYMTIKEKQIITKLSKAIAMYNISDMNETFEQTFKLETAIFNDAEYMSRIPTNSMDYTNATQMHDYKLLVDFVDNFFTNSRLRAAIQMTTSDGSDMPNDLFDISIDERQVLSAMASMFSISDDTNRNLRLFFENGNTNNGGANSQSMMVVDEPAGEEEEITVVRDSSTSRFKKVISSNRSKRESTTYATKILILLVYFTIMEENRCKCDEAAAATAAPPLTTNVRVIRNVLIRVLTRMVEHILEYVQYLSTKSENQKIRYSRLPIISNVLSMCNLREMPITNLLFTLQYTLNFAAFIINAE